MRWWIWLALVAGCWDGDRTVSTLEAAGYVDIETDGWAPGSCLSDESVATRFRATNPNGQRVEGAVCCGVLSAGCAIRF